MVTFPRGRYSVFLMSSSCFVSIRSSINGLSSPLTLVSSVTFRKRHYLWLVVILHYTNSPLHEFLSHYIPKVVTLFPGFLMFHEWLFIYLFFKILLWPSRYIWSDINTVVIIIFTPFVSILNVFSSTTESWLICNSFIINPFLVNIVIPT